MKLTITSDGEPCGTRVVAEDGRDLTSLVTEVHFRHVGGDIPQADVTLALVPIEVAGVMTRMVAPGGREVRRIEYADGEVVEFEPNPIVSIAPMDGRVRKSKL